MGSIKQRKTQRPKKTRKTTYEQNESIDKEKL